MVKNLKWETNERANGSTATHIHILYGVGGGYEHLEYGFLPYRCRVPSATELDVRKRVLLSINRELRKTLKLIDKAIKKLE